MAFSQRELERDLRRLGVNRSQVLFVHSSFKSLGPVEGGGATVIAALEAVLGAEGTLLMPSFNMASRNRTERAANWAISTTPSSTGYLTEVFRQMPGTLRSDHYSHSVAARGVQADWLIDGHTSPHGWISPWDRPPWGRTYGSESPMIRALSLNVAVLLLGVDYECLTYSHVAEVSDYNRRLQTDSEAPYYFVNRHVVGEWWQEMGRHAAGPVGAAPGVLFSTTEFVRELTHELEMCPGRFYAGWPG